MRLVHSRVAVSFDGFRAATQQVQAQRLLVARAMARWRRPVVGQAFEAWVEHVDGLRMVKPLVDLNVKLAHTQAELLSWVKMEHFTCQQCTRNKDVDLRLPVMCDVCGSMQVSEADRPLVEASASASIVELHQQVHKLEETLESGAEQFAQTAQAHHQFQIAQAVLELQLETTKGEHTGIAQQMLRLGTGGTIRVPLAASLTHFQDDVHRDDVAQHDVAQDDVDEHIHDHLSLSPNAKTIIGALILTLDMHFSKAGGKGSHQRQQFEKSLVQDLAEASGLGASCFHVQSMSAGSIIVAIQIWPDPSGMACNMIEVLSDLERQAQDQSSPLRNGAITSATACLTTAANPCDTVDEHGKHQSTPASKAHISDQQDKLENQSGDDEVDGAGGKRPAGRRDYEEEGEENKEDEEDGSGDLDLDNLSAPASVIQFTCVQCQSPNDVDCRLPLPLISEICGEEQPAPLTLEEEEEALSKLRQEHQKHTKLLHQTLVARILSRSRSLWLAIVVDGWHLQVGKHKRFKAAALRIVSRGVCRNTALFFECWLELTVQHRDIKEREIAAVRYQFERTQRKLAQPMLMPLRCEMCGALHDTVQYNALEAHDINERHRLRMSALAQRMLGRMLHTLLSGAFCHMQAVAVRKQTHRQTVQRVMHRRQESQPIQHQSQTFQAWVGHIDETQHVQQQRMQHEHSATNAILGAQVQGMKKEVNELTNSRQTASRERDVATGRCDLMSTSLHTHARSQASQDERQFEALPQHSRVLEQYVSVLEAQAALQQPLLTAPISLVHETRRVMASAQPPVPPQFSAPTVLAVGQIGADDGRSLGHTSLQKGKLTGTRNQAEEKNRDATSDLQPKAAAFSVERWWVGAAAVAVVLMILLAFWVLAPLDQRMSSDDWMSSDDRHLQVKASTSGRLQEVHQSSLPTPSSVSTAQHYTSADPVDHASDTVADSAAAASTAASTVAALLRTYDTNLTKAMSDLVICHKSVVLLESQVLVLQQQSHFSRHVPAANATQAPCAASSEPHISVEHNSTVRNMTEKSATASECKGWYCPRFLQDGGVTYGVLGRGDAATVGVSAQVAEARAQRFEKRGRDPRVWASLL